MRFQFSFSHAFRLHLSSQLSSETLFTVMCIVSLSLSHDVCPLLSICSIASDVVLQPLEPFAGEGAAAATAAAAAAAAAEPYPPIKAGLQVSLCGDGGGQGVQKHSSSSNQSSSSSSAIPANQGWAIGDLEVKASCVLERGGRGPRCCSSSSSSSRVAGKSTWQ